jgi:hypothetical protein
MDDKSDCEHMSMLELPYRKILASSDHEATRNSLVKTALVFHLLRCSLLIHRLTDHRHIHIYRGATFEHAYRSQ